jgi:hypothetical protein
MKKQGKFAFLGKLAITSVHKVKKSKDHNFILMHQKLLSKMFGTFIQKLNCLLHFN